MRFSSALLGVRSSARVRAVWGSMSPHTAEIVTPPLSGSGSTASSLSSEQDENASAQHREAEVNMWNAFIDIRIYGFS